MRNPTLSTILCSLFLISFLLPLASPSPPSSLSRRSSLIVGDESAVLLSPDKSFTCGFYEVGSNAYAFSIWFSNSADKAVVWTANRDRPVNGHGSRITLRKDGAMVLTDYDGAVVWSTNTSSTQAFQAQLLDTGNLVVIDPVGNVLWQSFDSPTDTLLPTQVFNRNMILISAAAKGVLTSGHYKSYFDSNNVLILIYDTPKFTSIYWPDPGHIVWENGRTSYNSSRYAVLDEEGWFASSDNLTFKASDMGLVIRRRLTLDHDGNLRLYSLNESTGMWSVSWMALSSICLVHGICGRNGICVFRPKPQCSCPPGFEVSDPSDWSKGCKRKFDISCRGSHEVKFVELSDTDYWGSDFNYTPSLSFRACRKICKKDCSCEAFGYKKGSGKCYPKTALFNGKSYAAAGNNIFLKLPRVMKNPEFPVLQGRKPVCNATETEATVPSSNLNQKRSWKTKWSYFYGFLAAFFGIEFLFAMFGWWFLFRREQQPTPMEEGYKAISSQFRRFTYKELRKATKKFKEELGRGGSGVVYKGVLDDERVVAVKKLEDVVQGEEEFRAELSFIGRMYHMNLVRMWGFCSEGSHRLLVSEFVENGSLDRVLFNGDENPSLLRWSERFKIAVGVAKGLAYLHHECLEWVIHCDVKPENILLGQDFEPKIADFGVAKLLNRGGSGSSLSRIRGTRGYMAPEWASNLTITGKVDVYSYGVVLLEMVKGSRVSDWVIDGDDEAVEMVLRTKAMVLRKNFESGEESWIRDFVDSRLNGQFDSKQALTMVTVAISCLETERNRRPSMDSVVQMLLASDYELDSHPAD